MMYTRSVGYGPGMFTCLVVSVFVLGVVWLLCAEIWDTIRLEFD